MATAVYTINDFVTECQNFKYSDEYFGMLKESYEIMLAEKYIESREYIKENCLKSSEYMHFGEGSETISDDKSWEYITTVASEKKEGLLKKVADGIKKLLEMAHKAWAKIVEKFMKLMGKDINLKHDNVEKALENPEAVKEMLDTINAGFENNAFDDLTDIKLKSTYSVPTGEGVSEKDAGKLAIVLTLLTEDEIEIDPRSFSKKFCDAEGYSEMIDAMYDNLSDAANGDQGKLNQAFANILKNKANKVKITEKAMKKALSSLERCQKLNEINQKAFGLEPEDFTNLNETTAASIKFYSELLNFRTEYRPKFSAIVDKYDKEG